MECKECSENCKCNKQGVLSGVEQELYNYIKEKVNPTYDDIKKDLGEKYVGASGKLISKNLVIKDKKVTGEEAQIGYGKYGIKYVKILKIKKESDNE